MTGQNSAKSPGTLTGLEIAVIGMAGKFPGAKNIDEFWDNLKEGRETITFFSEKELEETGMDPGLIKSPNYVKTKPLLEGRDCFDASFFGYTSGEAEIMAPHVRLFYECTWWALEDAGYDPTAYNGLIGCYAGSSSSFYWQELSIKSGKNDELGKLNAVFLTDKDMLSTRMAYKLNLKGPCLSIHTACSTSLVAIHLACRAVLTGECEIALAGGAALNTADEIGYMCEEKNIYSVDGHCKAFDARASGTNLGEGVGVVVLKRLPDAVNDRDNIYAIIKGSAINNDGTTKIGFNAPSALGMEKVVKLAHQVAGVEPESISYVETHGTGTPMGDPVEIEALKKAFNRDKKQFCAVGSVKTNVGHLEVAAGVTGLIKTVLALKYRLIPPTIHYENPNPGINFENSPFYVNTGLKEWKSEIYPLRAGVSAFGVGGTNAHVVLEEAPQPVSDDSSSTAGETGKERKYQLILLSAQTPSALGKISENLTEYFKKNLLNHGNHENSTDPHPTLGDAAYTLQVGRKAFKHRKALVVPNIKETVRFLESSNDHAAGNPSKVRTARSREKNRLVFMFPDQGEQYINMGRDLYHTERVFREEINLCFEILKSLRDDDIKEILYPSFSVSPAPKKLPAISNLHLTLDDTEIAQPVLFSFEYALSQLLMEWGIEPYAMMGHGIGEYVSACLSGVFSLEDALKVVALRGKLMQQMPPSHASHPDTMDPILEPFEAILKEIKLNKPQRPYISNMTGKWITVEQAVSPRYWSLHLRNCVGFADGLTQLLKEPGSIFIEVGPGRSLSTLARKHTDKKNGHVTLNLVKLPKDEATDDYYLLNNISQLWLYGEKIDWSGFHRDEKRRRIPLPGYPFEGKRYWLKQVITK